MRPGHDIGTRIMAAVAGSLDDDTFIGMFSPDGLGRTCQWHAEDDWIVEYSTERVRGGKLDGYFCVFLFKPVGKGSRAGRKGAASRWERVKVERCDTRREAKQRAARYYYEHSPKTAQRHGVTRKVDA